MQEKYTATMSRPGGDRYTVWKFAMDITVYFTGGFLLLMKAFTFFEKWIMM